MLHLPTMLKGVDIRRMATVRDAAFIGYMHDILPRVLITRNSDTNTPTHGFFDLHLESLRAAAVCEAWARFQAATAVHLGDVDARVMEREAAAASGSQKELAAFLNQANNSRLENEALGDAHVRVQHDAFADAFRDH
eukprot:jgi/Tetstr1/439386/TSEL_027821.t1